MQRAKFGDEDMQFGSHEEKQAAGTTSEATSRVRAASPDVAEAAAETQQIALGNLAVIERVGRSTQPVGAAPRAWHARKRLRREHLNSAEHRAMLVNSARALLGARLPHLVRVLDVQEAPEPVVALEFVEGASLAQCLGVSAPEQSVRYVAPILVDVLQGLQALHTCTGAQSASRAGASVASFVHGAPVARHILVGIDGSVRLTDYTHLVGPGLPWSELHEQRLRPEEMAPEQALAPAHLDPRCDVFVVGIVLWQALTGRALFGAGERGATLQRMLRQLIELPSETGVRYESGLDQVCLRALQRTRAERYASAAEFADALRSEATRRGCYASREEIGAWVAHCLESALCARADPRASTESGVASSEVQAARSRRGAAARKSRALAQAELQGTPARPRDIAHTTLTGWPVMLPDNAPRTPSHSVRTRGLSEEVRSRVESRTPRYDEAQASLIPERRRGRTLQPLAGVLVGAAALLILFSVSDDREPRPGREGPPPALGVEAPAAAEPARVSPQPSDDARVVPRASAPQALPVDSSSSAREPARREQAIAKQRTRSTPRARAPVQEPERPGYAASIESGHHDHEPASAAARSDDLTIPNNPYE